MCKNQRHLRIASAWAQFIWLSLIVYVYIYVNFMYTNFILGPDSCTRSDRRTSNSNKRNICIICYSVKICFKQYDTHRNSIIITSTLNKAIISRIKNNTEKFSMKKLQLLAYHSMFDSQAFEYYNISPQYPAVGSNIIEWSEHAAIMR